jgi:hypothetical protein
MPNEIGSGERPEPFNGGRKMHLLEGGLNTSEGSLQVGAETLPVLRLVAFWNCGAVIRHLHQLYGRAVQ